MKVSPGANSVLSGIFSAMNLILLHGRGSRSVPAAAGVEWVVVAGQGIFSRNYKIS